MNITDNATQFIGLIPQEIVTKVAWVLQAIGGLFAIYIILIIIKMFLLKREIKILKKIEKDIILIKKNLKIKTKK